MSARREAVLAAIRGVAQPDDPVTLPASWILEAIGGNELAVEVDLSAATVAEMLGRSPVTIAMWCRVGLFPFPGAYRLRGREWRITRAALAAFQRSGGAPTSEG